MTKLKDQTDPPYKVLTRSITSSAFPRFYPREYDTDSSVHSGPLPSGHNRKPRPYLPVPDPDPTTAIRFVTDYSIYDYPPPPRTKSASFDYRPNETS